MRKYKKIKKNRIKKIKTIEVCAKCEGTGFILRVPAGQEPCECTSPPPFFTKEYPAPDWAVEQYIRASGLVEDICKHGVGHPNVHWLKKHDPDGKRCFGVHGCDGCCSPKE